MNQTDFDEDIDIEQTKVQEAIQTYFSKDEFQFNNCPEKEILEMVGKFEPLNRKDECRHPLAQKDGGKECKNQKMISAMRSVGKYIIQQIGKKILSGDLNLTRISFPIKAMVAKSALENTLQSAIFFPMYINRASMMKHNRIEKMKLIITATIASFHVNCSFHKPLNPILGETVQGHLEDGTQLYAEQISHHPPISYFYGIGREKSYKYYGYYVYEAKAGLNSITLKNNGRRIIEFPDDKQRIEYNFAYEQYSGTFMGVVKVETLGKMIFSDKEIEATITLGKTKKKPTDYFQGEIKMQGEIISQIYGTYMGFIEFDGIRYWDFRDINPFKVTIDKQEMQSDFSQRPDLILLQLLDVDGAQKEKERLENIQRQDAKLRLKFSKKKN